MATVAVFGAFMLTVAVAVHARERVLVGLSATPQLGPTRCKRLIARFGNVENIFRVSLTELEAAGLPAAAAQSIALGHSLKLADEELEKASKVGAKVITAYSREFPEQLKHIYDPPMVLYVRGNASALELPGIAVIGTRHPTPYGMGMAERLAADLANRGFVILSGMARGVDTAAHRGAVNAKGKTIAVFGTGIATIYPR